MFSLSLFLSFFVYRLSLEQMHGIEADPRAYLVNNNNFDSSYAGHDIYERNHTNSADSLATLMESDESSKTE